MQNTARPNLLVRNAAPVLRLPLLILLALALIICGSGYALFKRLQQNETQRIQQNLASIAQLKSDQITGWLNEHRVDAKVLAYNSGISERVTRWLERGGRADDDAARLNSRLKELKALYALGELTITDNQGNARLSTAPGLPDMTSEQGILRQATDGRQTVFGELRWISALDGTSTITLPMAAPILSLDGRMMGALWFEIDAQHFLFPLVQSWPVPTETAETLLVIRDRNDVLYLNELRNQQETALNLRTPIDHPTRVAARALRGETGLMAGTDYRDRNVLAYAVPISGTNWTMVSKIDEGEAYAPIRRIAITLTAGAIGLLLVSSGMLYLWWRQRKVQYQAAYLQSELDQQFRHQQYEFLSKSANDIILLLNNDYRIIEVNDRAEQAFGYSREELIGQHLAGLRAGISKEEFERLSQLIKQNKSMVFESLYRRRDGTEFPVEVSARVMERGNTQFIQGIFRDITERKKAETILRESEQRFRVALSNSQVSVFEQDRELRYTWIYNPRFGYEVDEVIGRRDADLMEPDCAEEIETIKRSVLEEKHPFRHEMCTRTRSGEPECFDLYIEPRRDEAGNIIGIAGTSIDTTERKLAARRLERITRLLQETQSVAKVGGWELNVERQIMYWTEETYRIHETSPGEYQPTVETALQFYAPEDVTVITKAGQDAIEHKIPFDLELQLITAKGRRIWVRTTCSITEGDGRASRIIGAFQDITERKEAELALRESEARLRAAMDSMVDEVWFTDAQGRILLTNNAAVTNLGFGNREPFFKDIQEALALLETFEPDGTPRSPERAPLPRALQGESLKNEGELLRNLRTGELRYREVSAAPIRDAQDRIIGSVAVVRDLTERKRTEDALKESEAQFRQLTESLPQLVFTTLANGFNEYYNERWVEFAGTRPNEVEGEFWSWLLHPDDYERAVTTWRHSLQTGAPYQIEYRFRSKNGTYRWFLTRATPLRNQAGDIVRWFGTCTDIHEQKQAQAALQDSETRARRTEERLRLAQQVARIGSFEWNIQTGANEWSPEAEVLYGITSGSFGGTYEAWLACLHPDGRDKAEQDIQDAFNTGFYDSEFRVVWPDGSLHWIAARGKIFNDESGQPLRMVGVNIDITERKNAEARERRLANMYRALGETNDAIVHLESEAGLFSLICRVAAEYGDMAQAWVGIPDEECNFTPLTRYGRAHDYLTEILRESTLSCDPTKLEGRGPAGIAYREGRPVIANDFVKKVEHVTAWMKAAQRHGIHAGAVFPIKRGGQPYAVFIVYSEHADAFDDEIVHLLEEIASNVSFALDNLNRERERRHAEEELQLAALVYHESAEAMMVTDEADNIVSVNPAFETLTGYQASDVIGKNPLMLSAGPTSRPSYREMMQWLAKSHYWQGELWLKKKGGEEFAAGMTINTIFHANGKVNRHVALFTDVTQRKIAEERVWHQANFDTLTGLPNRQHFLDQLSIEIRKARRYRLSMALLFLDLDGFKHVNDTLGHEVGDLLLKEAAERLKRCMRESDTVARLGGDEFTVILPELQHIRHVETVARHILHKLSEPFELGRDVAHVSGSVGITLFPQDASNMDDLLINADHAMYAAKEAGKNRYSFFTAEMQQAAQERTWLINELRGAIDNRQLKLVYQPIVELSTGCINKAEALLRWEHPERGMIEPSVFIPVAEESGMIHEIGNWVFLEAANQAVKWRHAYHPDFQISINRSPIQFKARVSDMARWLAELKHLNLPGQAIAVEITEGILMDESTAVADQLLAFRDAGIEVSLDDFGTGYSSLAYLKRFDIDRLKIDQVFVRDLETNPDDQALCEAMIVMGHKLGIKVIAEGVETDGQRNLLAIAGCDFVQGYLLSTPVSAEELDELLKRGSTYCPGMQNS